MDDLAFRGACGGGNGEWRDAIHLAYWAGISFLERQGFWKPDRARTPREYLRLSLRSEYRETLRALTQIFELAWYAKPASRQVHIFPDACSTGETRMPLKIDPRDRKRSSGGGRRIRAAHCWGGHVWRGAGKNEIPSSYSSGSGGAKATFLLFQVRL